MKNHPITFVNFCVDIGRDNLPINNSIYRSFELYKAGMSENIMTILPLVLYTSEHKINIPNHRNESNFRHHFFDEQSIENEFPNFELYRTTYPITHKDEISSSLFYYSPLVVLKMKKMIDVVNENPFNSELFFWIDCFFVRGIIENEFLYDEDSFLKMSENVKNKLNDKFVILDDGRRPFGFFWGGSKKVLELVYEKYFEIFFESLPVTILTEELIFKILMERYPDLFHIEKVYDLSKYKITCQNFLLK